MSERLTAETDGSSSPDFLLPTPSAQESTPTGEFLEEFRTHLDPDDPLHRLWLPGRKWMTQRTLSRTVPALLPKGEEDLLPTPGAWLGRRPENSMADPERAASREHEGTRGKRSVELPDAIAAEVRLLPTPVVSDSRGLTDGETRDGGPSLREVDRLLPTPTTQDGENTAGPSQRERNSPPLNLIAADAAVGKLLPTPTAQTGGDGERPDGFRRLLGPEIRRQQVDGKLLPTPTAGDSEASGSRNLEGSRAHSGVSLTDAIQTGDSRTPRLLPTPQAADGDGGRQERGAMSQSGRRPSGQKATLPLGTAISMRETISETPFTQEGEQPTLLPTPVANEENPGAGGELRAALTHGESRRNETGTDTMGRPNRGRTKKLLPTPMSSDGEKGSKGQRFGTGGPTLSSAVNEETSNGASTDPPSTDGSESSDGQLPLLPTNRDD
jgi:hypothetical protein